MYYLLVESTPLALIAACSILQLRYTAKLIFSMRQQWRISMPFTNIPEAYYVWASMKDRCYNPNNRQFRDYGGRGITVCDRWLSSYHDFISDMGPRPEKHSIDRIDNNGNYEPGNCRWADKKTQQRNQRRAVFVEIEGKTYRAIELAEEFGLKTDTIVSRAKNGMSYADVTFKGKHRDLSGLSKG